MSQPYAPKKIYTQEDLDFYLKQLTEASGKHDTLATAQAFANIQELTGWSTRKMAQEIKSAHYLTILRYVKILQLPEEILNAWASKRLPATVAMEFLKIEPGKRLRVYKAAKTESVPFHKFLAFIKKQNLSGDDSVTEEAVPESIKPKETQLIPLPPEPAPLRPVATVDIASPGILPTWQFGNLIADGSASIVEALRLSGSQIEQELPYSHDITRLRSMLRALIEQSEIALSFLNHISETRKIRNSMRSYDLPPSHT